MDISGICNAQCPWCDTGGRKIGFLPFVKEANTLPYMTAEYAEFLLKYLLSKNFIDTDTVITLFNWGEPFLNKEIFKIVNVLNELNLSSHISTNSSVKLNIIHPYLFRNVRMITLSMPGFSQKSYDMAHGFKFGNILANIKHNVKIIRRSGFLGNFSIALHIYKFNLHEVDNVRIFARSMGIFVNPVLAHPNSLDYYFMLRKKVLRFEVYEKMLSDLFFAAPDVIKSFRPPDYECRQWQYLTLTWQGNLSLCCCVGKGKDLNMAHITEISPEESYTIRRNHKTCKECSDMGIDYYFNNPHCYSSFLIQEGKSLEKIFCTVP
jgi:MoaA/NifB/PqqE/SkfB family radical SAM enzyme